MKRYFTLSALTLCTGVAFAFSPLQDLNGEDVFVDKKAETVQLKKDFRFNRLSFESQGSILDKIAPRHESTLGMDVTVNRAIADGSKWNLSYALPGGAFFTNISYLQTIKRKSDGEMLQARRIGEQLGFVVPPFVENEWTNLVQKTSFTATGSINTEWLPETESLKWIAFSGDYTDSYIYNRFDSECYDLAAVSKPSMADRPLMAPAFFYGDDVFQMVDKTGQYVTSMYVGGSGGWSQKKLASLQDEFETTLNNAERTPVIVTISDAQNGRATLYDDDNWISLPLNGRMVVGNQAGLIFNGISANDAFQKQWETFGYEDFTFDGFYERIPASNADYIAKSLEISALYYGPASTPISYRIYDISGDTPALLQEGQMTPTEELLPTDERDADGNVLYGGQITLEASLEDVFAEEEGAFLNVKAGTELMIEFVGGEQVAAFGPWMTEYDYSNGPDINTAKNLAGAVVLDSEGGMGMIPMNLFFGTYATDPLTGEETDELIGFNKHTSFMVGLEIEYPYLAAFSRFIPASQESNGVTHYGNAYDFYGDEKDAVDIQFLNFKYNETDGSGNLTGNVMQTNCAIYNLVSNAKAADIVLTYSDDAVKNAVVAAVEDGDQIKTSTSTYDAGYVSVYIAPVSGATLPTTGWVKASYKGHEVTFNLTETSGIEDVVANDGEAVATEYFDLQGRKVAGEAKGIMIKKMTMADGSVKAVKVVK